MAESMLIKKYKSEISYCVDMATGLLLEDLPTIVDYECLWEEDVPPAEAAFIILREYQSQIIYAWRDEAVRSGDVAEQHAVAAAMRFHREEAGAA